MPGQTNPFRFKQFIVHHDRCTMKVGTDAVLLGAWANQEDAKTILDIGTGSGILALMLAQRSSPGARVDAVELEECNFNQATENVRRSPWKEKITLHHTSIQEYAPETKYDLIVCNPPYFVNSLHPPSAQRTTARHATTLSQDELLASVSRLLSQDGIFAVILPTAEGDNFQGKVRNSELHIVRRTAFYSRQQKPQERWLMEFRFRKGEPLLEERLLLYHQGNEWSKEYKRLTNDFYLSAEKPRRTILN